MSYGISRTVNSPFQQAVEKARTALAAQGFGVLCEIDIKEKLKEKLGADFTNYLILGACNPPLAHRALQEEMELGLLLPCNVIVYQQGSATVVAAIDAEKMLSVVDNPKVLPVAREVNQRLRKVIDAI